jgi:hypothetical protein
LANLGSESPQQKSSPTETRPGTESEKRLRYRPQYAASHFAGCVLCGLPILFNIEHNHSRSQMLDGNSYFKMHPRTQFLNAVVMLSEAKDL